MKTRKQTFPPVTIEALSNGLFRLEDTYVLDEPCAIELHPTQIQVLASMVGFTLPDKSRAALERVISRINALHKQAGELEHMLRFSVCGTEALETELTAAEFIAFNLGELVHDIEAIKAPDLEPIPDALANPGGQLTLAV
ncbi:MAG: hypothetical protein QM749_19780 [Aquabacterium sp.]